MAEAVTGAGALKSRAKKSNHHVIRKGRPLSNAGRHADGPRDDDHRMSYSIRSNRSTHMIALRASRPQRAQFRIPSFRISSDPSETTYTRSRRKPGEAKPGQDEAKKSQRPARSLKGRALGYLSRREYSRAELARKLKPFVEETDSLETLLDALEAENWLSDSRFAESLIHRRSSRLGASRILGELKQHAVDQTLVEEASAQLRETELARAQAVWRKKFGELPETPAERAKQARFLASRGFSGATIGKILKGIDEE